MELQEEIKTIRVELRSIMNGITATSMREKGVHYKLNFGASLPDIQRIASQHQPNAELAQTLWKEDVREFKILATMLQPADQFTVEQALEWTGTIPYLEIAEHCCRNLFSKIEQKEELISELFKKTDMTYARTVAFLVGVNLLAQRKAIGEETISELVHEANNSLLSEAVAPIEKQAAVKLLKFYGRQSSEQAKRAIEALEAHIHEGNAELNEYYNELKFEFDYYK
jgi:3-methyladenine DNA glycosylase AlkD